MNTVNITTFQDLQLIEPIQRVLASEKYLHPTPIQSQAIPHLLAGSDLLGCAQTGTGKTAAFALPILQRLDQDRKQAQPRSPRVLVLSPTRELASQIADSFRTYGKHLQIKHTVVFGGVGQNPQVQAMKRGVHILVATPGRLLDLMNQGYIRLDQLETFVLDEADRMLDMGFLPDLKRIISALPKQRQSLFFSATMASKVGELASSLLRNPVKINITPPASTVEMIEQKVMFVSQGDKRSLLQNLLETADVKRCLVFTRTKHGADKVAKQLAQSGHLADAIHGNKSQSARERVLHQFRTGKIHVLVATDVAARGIDVDGISHVINFDLPHEPDSYVHRIGRTGRAGATGIALSFCDASERGLLRDIERLVRRQITVDAEHPFHAAGVQRSSGPAVRSENGPRRDGFRSEVRRPAAPARKTFSNSGPSANKGRTRRRKMAL